MLYSPAKAPFNQISKIGLGTAHFGSDYGFSRKKTQDEVDAILEACFQSGINVIDTARGYGDSEEKIGNYLQRHPVSNLLLSTKLAYFLPESSMSEQKRTLSESIAESQRQLRINQIPLLKFHQDASLILDHPEFWNWIQEFKSKKWIQFFGVSFYEPEIAEKIMDRHGPDLDFVQFPFNLLDQRYAVLFEKFRRYSIGTVSRSAFLKGLLAKSEDDLPATVGNYFKTAYRKVRALAENKGISLKELALLFSVLQEGIHSTVIGFDSVVELRDCERALDKLSQINFSNIELEALKTDDLNLIDPRRWTGF